MRRARSPYHRCNLLIASLERRRVRSIEPKHVLEPITEISNIDYNADDAIFVLFF